MPKYINNLQKILDEEIIKRNNEPRKSNSNKIIGISSSKLDKIK
jgi:hypothetical protein